LSPFGRPLAGYHGSVRIPCPHWLYKILVRLANYSGGGKILIVDFDICILPKYIGEGGGENASGKGE